MQNLAEIIEQFDTIRPVREQMIKMIPLKHALAEDFANLLKQTLVGEGGAGDVDEAILISFMEKLPDGREIHRKLLRQDISVEPDARTNSLMVMAPTESMALIEAMIRAFDEIRPVTSELRLFPLINSDAATMAEQLTELFDPSAGDGETRTQLILPEGLADLELPNVGQELRFVSDPRTNTLIAAGAEIDLRMVEELVRYLDSQEAEDRVVNVYHAKFRDAEELAATVQGFIDQELDALDNEEAQMRRMERQVSIQSLGSEEEGSSSLIWGSSRRAYQRTLDMIESLDRPEPQVMLSVVIAEVTYSDEFELGIEIAGQDLRFSEQAVLGPNGIIQGPDFDWIAGTDLGAAGLGLGGFNFTLTGEDLSFLLHALQVNSRLEILSSPILLIRNGEEGNITIADNVPFVEGSAVTTGGVASTNIGREDVGIVLTATPHISPDGYVTIELEQEVSSFSGENQVIAQGVTSPIFSERTVRTNVTVRDGETVIVGGLMQTRESEGVNKVPFLGDLPWIGALFRTTSITKQRTELLVILTVDVVRTDADMHMLAEKHLDMFELSPALKKSPWMRGLRILPDETGLGPVEDEGDEEGPEREARPTPLDERRLYGPKPKTYGPILTRPTSAQTARRSVYGPTIARSELANPS